MGKTVCAPLAGADYKGPTTFSVLCGLAALLVTPLLASASSRAGMQTSQSPPVTAPEAESEIANTVRDDIRAIATAPLHIGRVKDVTWRQVAVGMVIIGGIVGLVTLDEDIREGASHIDNRDADLMQNVSFGLSIASIPLLYGVGVWKNQDQWWRGAIAAAESTLVAFGLSQLVKTSAGRERPDMERGAHKWFEGGQSFVSDVAAHTFATAEGVSAAVDHTWWVTIPSYTFALAVGTGRLGQDRHWASDIAGSALLGIGTAKLFAYLHAARRVPASTAAVAPVSFSGGGIGLRWHFGF